MDHLTVAQEKLFQSPFGQLACKIPSAKQQMEIARRTQFYAGGLPLAAQDWDLAEAMARLDVLIVQEPAEFVKDKNANAWDYDKIYDTEALIKLGKEIGEWVGSFRKSVRTEQGEVGA